MTNQHLSHEERYQIEAFMKAGQSQTQIAEHLGRHRTTIHRELNRNSGQRGYRPKQASELAAERAQGSRNAVRITTDVLSQANAYLALQWSPVQIAENFP